MISITEWRRQFLEYLEIERGRSVKTAAAYDRYLTRFFRFAEGVTKPEAITVELLRRYRLWLNRQAGTAGETIKKNTQNYHLIALRTFLKYLAGRGLTVIPPSSIELAKIPARELSLNDCFKLLTKPRRSAGATARFSNYFFLPACGFPSSVVSIGRTLILKAMNSAFAARGGRRESFSCRHRRNRR